MGATTSLLAMSRSSSLEVTCWLGIDPRTNLAALAEADPAIRDQILAAWGEAPERDEAPLAVAGSLPQNTVYRVGVVSGDPVLQSDASALSAALQSAGRAVSTVPGDSRDPAVIVPTLEGCGA
jgi:hypothetical protein